MYHTLPEALHFKFVTHFYHDAKVSVKYVVLGYIYIYH